MSQPELAENSIPSSPAPPPPEPAQGSEFVAADDDANSINLKLETAEGPLPKGTLIGVLLKKGENLTTNTVPPEQLPIEYSVLDELDHGGFSTNKYYTSNHEGYRYLVYALTSDDTLYVSERTGRGQAYFDRVVSGTLSMIPVESIEGVPPNRIQNIKNTLFSTRKLHPVIAGDNIPFPAGTPLRILARYGTDTIPLATKLPVYTPELNELSVSKIQEDTIRTQVNLKILRHHYRYGQYLLNLRRASGIQDLVCKRLPDLSAPAVSAIHNGVVELAPATRIPGFSSGPGADEAKASKY